MRKRPAAQLTLWQTVLLDRMPDTLHGGVHAGVQHALMTGAVRDDDDSEAGRSFFDEVAHTRVGHLATGATAALLDLIGPLVPDHSSMDQDAWSAGLRAIEPRLATLVHEARRGLPDLPRDIAAALRPR